MTDVVPGRRRRSPEVARAELAAAAVVELEEVGIERTSLRSIARRAGMTHQAAGHHFADRSALYTAVAASGFRDLFKETRREVDAVAGSPRPGAAVAAVGCAYVAFARANPARFELMFRQGLLDLDDVALREARREMWHLLRSSVVEGMEQGWAAGADPDEVTLSAWALVHGLAALEAGAGVGAATSLQVIQTMTDLLGRNTRP